MNSPSIELRLSRSLPARRFGLKDNRYHLRNRRARVDAIANALDPLESRMLLTAYSVIGGGRGVNMFATGGAGDTTLAFLDSDLTHLHVEEYVGTPQFGVGMIPFYEIHLRN